MQVVLDFITGKTDCETFKELWYSDPSIGKWVDGLIDLRSEPKPEWNAAPYAPHRMAIHKHYNGSLLKYLEASDRLYNPKIISKIDRIGWYFDAIAAVVVIAYPNLIPTSIYKDEEAFYEYAVCGYMRGSEVDNYIYDQLNNIPKDISMKQRKVLGKNLLKELFHIEKAKYPRWVQEPEWPMGRYSPMKFMCQNREGDLVKFVFEDVDTHFIRTIEQLF